MNNPSKLIKIINETNPTLANKIVSHHFNEIINNHYYNEIVNLSTKINPSNLNNFFDAMVMSTPYDQDPIISIAKSSNSKQDYDHILVESLKKNNENLYELLTNIDFDIISKDASYFHSRNPNDIIRFAASTNSCLQRKSASFYEKMGKDPGTIYVFGEGENNSGYVRLVVSQNMNGEGVLCVDNFKFDFHSKEFIDDFSEKLVLFKERTNLPIVDRAVFVSNSLGKSRNFMDMKEDYYKTGIIPEKKAFSPIKLKENCSVLYI